MSRVEVVMKVDSLVNRCVTACAGRIGKSTSDDGDVSAVRLRT